MVETRYKDGTGYGKEKDRIFPWCMKEGETMRERWGWGMLLERRSEEKRREEKRREEKRREEKRREEKRREEKRREKRRGLETGGALRDRNR
ncbi:hypothetical protein HZH68_012373 [Vespula germanica]|uniref:Uncharacterized protein n=1 Tax=Vespula germanica TaxID=30212 RepID=A0A834JHB5_VESGE|nr:hypothetical protein HZH68_012373 [Vespula germanica]